MPDKVFICHSSHDHDFVIKLAERLKADSINVWIDDWEIKVSDSITQKINEALEDSSFFIIVFSENSKNSDWVNKELNATLMRQVNKRDITILPVLLDMEASQLPPLMQDIYAARFSKNRINESEYNKLVEPIKIKQDSDELRNYQDVFFENAEHIDIVLNKHRPSRKEIEFILNIIQDKDYENYFFRKIRSVDWFRILRSKSYFSPEKAPSPQPADKQGYFTIPVWNILPYLEGVSEQVKVPGSEIYIDDLLKIIKDITEYHVKNNKVLDNYHTWWHFVKILLNLPNEKIPFEIISLIPIWLDSKFDVMLPGSKIATELLPKCLPDLPTPEDIQKAEKILDAITDFKWEKDLDMSTRAKNEPQMLIDTFWLSESFIKQKNAIKIGERCTEKTIYILADKLKQIFRGQNPDRKVDINIDSKSYCITVTHLEEDEFHCSVGIYENKQIKSEESEEEFIKRFFTEPRELFNFELKECKTRKAFMENIKNEISNSIIFPEILEILDEKLEELYNNIFTDYSYIWIKSISAGAKFVVLRPEDTITITLRDIFLAKAKKEKSVTLNIFTNFLSDEYQYPLFRRLILFVICECWDDFREEFWKMVSADHGLKLFDDPNYEAEIYTLLENNIKALTPKEKERLNDIIEIGPQRYLPKDNVDYVNYWKQKWYSAVKSDPFFAHLYTKYRKTTEVEEEISFKEPKFTWGSGAPPLSKEEIVKISNTELVKILMEFKPEGFIKGPSVEGMGIILKETAKEKPEKFLSDPSPFLDTSYYYVYHILWGIRDAWNQKKDVDWGRLFDFIKKYIDRSQFWEDKFKMAVYHGWMPGHELVIGMTGELIQDGTKDDDWAFSENHLAHAQEIIFLIIDSQKPEKDQKISDPVNHALNSPAGKIISALINLALRIARLEGKQSETKKSIKWSIQLKDKYEKTLQEEVIEAYTLFGQYMPNLYYLDESWVKQKIKEFESIKEYLWSAFIGGYLFNSRIYDYLYQPMRKHYLRAIANPSEEKNAEERLINHIALNYLRGIEDLSDNSLFGTLLRNWNSMRIRQLIGFFWVQRDYLVKTIKGRVPIPYSDKNESAKARIIEFWKWVYDKYKNKESLEDEDKGILSDLTKLTVFLPRIDKEKNEWLMLSLPYVYAHFNSPFFIEYLNDLKDKDTKIESGRYVGSILLKTLDHFTPDYDKEHIKSIVSYLYEVRDRETIDCANKICNIYGSRGFDFLRQIYEDNKHLEAKE